MKTILALLALGIMACDSTNKPPNPNPTETYSKVKNVGAMKDVKWKGELEGKIVLDTIADRNGLYGLGPLSYLSGEILINDGKSYLSKVNADSTMTVEESYDISAPFFVYANVTEWVEVEVPSTVISIQELEKFIDNKTTDFQRPFVFKLKGQVSKAVIHIQNLPLGTKVSSPEQAHQGQVKYALHQEESEIIGFFSTEHKGIFTHHDSFLHMHLMTQDKSKMGHLDELAIKKMKLYLPKK